jgi:tetratricopeptide (TPR) repeat protein
MCPAAKVNPAAKDVPVGSGARSVETSTEARSGVSLAEDLHVEGLLPPGARLGRYVVLSRVGMGGLGVVYEAYDPDLDRRIAVKLLRQRTREGKAAAAGPELLQREARSLAKLSHRNVVAVYDVGVLDGRVFIAMEFVAGSTLRTWLGAEPRGWRAVVEAFREAGQGLGAAHHAGLVHRDFKPDNVLVRGDGHVCVTDFGLARAELIAGADAPSLLTMESATGGLAGTPAYMAPELWAGSIADARSDQFAFAVSLFEGLCGARPYGGTTLVELREAIVAGTTSELPAPTGVPPWLARAVLRGLSTDPEARFPSMKDMLAALAEPRPVRRGTLLTGIAAVVAVAAVTPVVLRARADRAAPVPVCRAGDDKVRGLWEEPRRQAVRHAFEATGASYAGQSWSAVDHAIAGFTHDWVAAYTDACEATRVRGEQSEQLLDERMVCLDQRRKEVAALADAYSHADGKAVDHAVEAAGEIEEPFSSCAPEALGGVKPWPKDPGVRAKLEEVQTQLALARSQREQGHYKDGRESARRALELAKATAYEPLQSEAGLELAGFEGIAGDRAARTDALDAAVLAQGQGLDAMAANAWIALVMIAGRESDYGPAELYARLARASIDRLGGEEIERRGRLLLYESYALVAQSRFPEALEASKSGLALIERATGVRSRKYVHGLMDQALVFGSMGWDLEALADYEQFVAITTDMLGPDHPETVEGSMGEAQALVALGRYAQALEKASAALPSMEQAYGPDNMTVATLRGLIAESMCGLDRCQEALPVVERALGSWAAQGEAAEPADGSVLYLYRAKVKLGLGDLRGAERDGRKGLELAGAATTDVSDFLDVLARTARARGSLAEALRYERGAIATLEKSSPDCPGLAPALATLGEILADRGESVEAQRAIERAVAIFDAHPTDPRALEAARALLPKLRAKNESDATGRQH